MNAKRSALPDSLAPRRYLVIAPVKDGKPGAAVQLQRP